MSSLDPITMATQLATYDVQPFQARYSTQTQQYQSQLKALKEVESALRDFRTAVSEMNSSTSSIIKNSATTSEEGFFSASADATALSGSYQIFVEQVATAHQVSASLPATLDSTTEIPLTGTMEFTVNGETMTLDLSTVDSDGDGVATMADLAKAINNDPNNPGVNATLVRSNGQTHFMLSSEETGVANSISVTTSGTGQAWFEDGFNTLNEITTPQDAIIWLGAKDTGLKLTESSNTFSNVIDGVDITVTKAQSATDAALTMDIGADEEATKEQVNKFIDAYNSLMSTIDKYSEVDSESQTRPVLASDPTLRSIESQLKSMIRSDFGGLRLADAGIEINRDGTMKLDAEKFEEAQLNNSTALEEMFNGDGNLLDSIDSLMEPYLQFSSGLFKSRKDAIQQNIDRIDDKQVALDRKYDMAYDRYLRQFTQMNTIMRQMNQTMSMFG
ncbi:flagellar filament capping protein FliD [Vibrio alginolyticus]|uniref:flagellar filament capping protein FliD n=1 Tax=Vibrio sp. B1FLJ16 TaxID=2751178 RepID=UPI0015F46D8D|nr:flagellar filament capping protein FliD [Vibrio sp. B1FLJ16]CAD7823416.1 morphogenesis and for the elongation of the flagellar filament by facilitating polymerization of the flagellin monomers at the tip of growing filament. Forms a capping structure [Vibrio sp. B1FLJ16]CAE6951829.1 morphogenesis and for the elongation of the flagellar filament by facilitating polymerization of the flagellin monomers at the tip of growing filament. Forms a capping structure [Vibrio sp. B1FLJ16]